MHIQVDLYIFQDFSSLKQLEQLLLSDWLLPSANDEKEHIKIHNNVLHSDWLLPSANGKSTAKRQTTSRMQESLFGTKLQWQTCTL